MQPYGVPKKALKVRAEKDHMPGGKWYWILPEDGPDDIAM